MTYDTKQLEDLGGYQPECAITGQSRCDCADCNLPASAPPKTLGQNSHVIRPETKVNKAEDAGQPLSCPKCGKTFPAFMKTEYNGHVKGCPNYYPLSCDKPEQPIKTGVAIPDPNQKIITEIEGLISQVKEKLLIMKITVPVSDKPESRAIFQARNEIAIYQNTALRELKQVFE